MRVNHFRIIVTVILLLHLSPLSGALLIFKTDPTTKMPVALTDSVDKENLTTIIRDILFKYEWPMSIASAPEMTDEERASLFASQTPSTDQPAFNNEEQFIQAKIDENANLTGYQVAFIPTALYELFCIQVIFDRLVVMNEKLVKNIHDNQGLVRSKLKSKKDADTEYSTLFEKLTDEDFLSQLIRDNITSLVPTEKKKIDLRTKLKDGTDYTSMLNTINNVYKEINNFFLDAAVYFNTLIVTTLIQRMYPQEDQNIQQKLANGISLTLCYERLRLLDDQINRIKKTRSNPMLSQGWVWGYHDFTIWTTFISNLNRDDTTCFIPKIMYLEYDAHKTNKGLLLRGASFINAQTSLDKKQPERIFAGSTLKDKEPSPTSSPLLQTYTQAENLFSVSFGNGLFDGHFNDKTACVYNFLNGGRAGFDEKASALMGEAGYALRINKKDYIDSACNHLFFISPLAPLASLFYVGEFFHSRSTAAIAPEEKEGDNLKAYKIEGLYGREVSDPAGIILVRRDPLEHAALFSEFLADKFIPILAERRPGISTEDARDQEKNNESAIRQAQQDAALYYRAAQKWQPLVPLLQKRLQRKYKRLQRTAAPLIKFINQQDKQHKTALQLAQDRGNPKVIEMILEVKTNHFFKYT